MYPFIFGAQYYRAPTPEPECWETDFARMRELGFTMVKLWVQWRWSHRRTVGGGPRFEFGDLDRLMDLAAANGLQVTLNTILDVAPEWLYEVYPTAQQVMLNGQRVEPYTVAQRQIGGHPGPCYNHPGALAERKVFLKTVLGHFRGHPALAMWDIWNEPEISFPQRTPRIETLVCYCEHCREGFRAWLKAKYGALQALNAVWGRCYDGWDDVELPRNPHTITDFIDWREFHMDTMTQEAAWRLNLARDLDPKHPAYLHVVPNVMSVFNSITCAADDFDMAEHCDVFAATMNGGPILASQIVSAARGKTVYNVESHVNHGCTTVYQRRLELPDLLRDWLPQIGLGVRGFLFWQYRPEVLGFESPAWGLTALDGTDRPVTRAVREFWATLRPHTEELLRCPPTPAEIGIWKSRKNEVFHWAIHSDLKPLIDSVEAYIHALYWESLPFRMVSGQMLERGELDGLRLLVMPSPYYLTEPESRQLQAWVEAGGVVLTEAHLGGYNGTRGRHSRVLPGCGLADAWGLREGDATSTYHVRSEDTRFEGLWPETALTDDTRKALAAFGMHGGPYVPIRLADGGLAWGASRYAPLEGEGLEVLGAFTPAEPLVVRKAVGKGEVFYAGSNLGQGAVVHGDAGLVTLLRQAAARAGIEPTGRGEPAARAHIDVLKEGGEPRFLVIATRGSEPIRVQFEGCWRGLFGGTAWEGEVELPGEWAELLVPACPK